jgi:hypothetical protein
MVMLQASTTSNKTCIALCGCEASIIPAPSQDRRRCCSVTLMAQCNYQQQSDDLLSVSHSRHGWLGRLETAASYCGFWLKVDSSVWMQLCQVAAFVHGVVVWAAKAI